MSVQENVGSMIKSLSSSHCLECSCHLLSHEEEKPHLSQGGQVSWGSWLSGPGAPELSFERLSPLGAECFCICFGTFF